MQSDPHILPLFVGDPERCKIASDLLLAGHCVYIQPINYPTAPRGSERLRIARSPHHDNALIDALTQAPLWTSQQLGLLLRDRTLTAE